MRKVNLGTPEDAFSLGGNRLCFVDPDNSNRCIKVMRLDRSPEARRAAKSFPKCYKPISSFDDNAEEHRVIQRIESTIGESAFELIPRFYGFVDTNLGRGLCCDLILDDDGLISISLKQYLWQQGMTEELESALARFTKSWKELAIPSRNLLLHNILVQRRRGCIERLVVIDGLGWPDLVPLANWIPILAKRKVASRIRFLYRAIDSLLVKRREDSDFGYHGWLTDEKRKVG